MAPPTLAPVTVSAGDREPDVATEAHVTVVSEPEEAEFPGPAETEEEGTMTAAAEPTATPTLPV